CTYTVLPRSHFPRDSTKNEKISRHNLPSQSASYSLGDLVSSSMSPLEKRIKNLSRGLSLSVTKLAKDIAPRYVHRLRTTIRRIEALVASAPLDLSKKQQGSLKKMAALRKRAGRVRDLDVQLD